MTARVEISPSNFGNKPEIDIKLAHQDPWVGDAQRTSRRMFLDSDSSTLESVHGRAETAGDDEDDAELGAADEGPKGVFVRRVVSGVEYRRPLAACWTAGYGCTHPTPQLSLHSRVFISHQPMHGCTDHVRTCVEPQLE